MDSPPSLKRARGISFDTGNGHSVEANSLTMNKDLRSIKKIFLSHGHYDHTGGLPKLLKMREKVDVHAHPHIFLDRISVVKDKKQNKTIRWNPL